MRKCVALKANEILNRIDYANVQLERFNDLSSGIVRAELNYLNICGIHTINIAKDDALSILELIKCYYQNLINQLEKELEEL